MTISKSRGGAKIVVKSELRLRKYKVIIQESVHHIDASSKSRHYPDKFTVVKNIPTLQNVKQQRSFHTMVNLYPNYPQSYTHCIRTNIKW